MNPIKFEMVRFKGCKFRFTIENTKIPEKTSVKYLGIRLDDKLNFLEHINHVLTKLSRYTGMFCQARKFFSGKV